MFYTLMLPFHDPCQLEANRLCQYKLKEQHLPKLPFMA